MSFREWWRNRSGKAKTITVLCALLILQIGLCFGTPSILDAYQAIFHLNLRADEEFGPGLGFMFFEALLCVVTVLVLFVVSLFWQSRQDPQKLFDSSDDEKK